MFVILDVRGFSYQTGWIIRIGLRDNFIKNNTLKRKRLQKNTSLFLWHCEVCFYSAKVH